MLYDTMFSEAYQIEGIIECSVYSVLFQGKKNDTGEPVLVRHWLAARTATEEAQRGIQTEVAELQAFQHPHILPILEVCTNEQGIYLVSAQPSGGTLAARLAQNFLKLLPFDEAWRIIAQIGQALHALHQRGLSHGNLTPQAVFFSETGRVRLGEFHLKSVLASIPNYQPAQEESIPSCWYMAPEQFSGVFDALTDQYALGCLAYHLLTGRVPFTGSARSALLEKHLQEQPGVLREFHSAIPAPVEDAVLKALAKRPEERHSSIQAFLDAFQLPLETTIADQDQDTVGNPWFVGGIDITAQATLVPELFEQPFDPAPAANSSDRRDASTLLKSALTGGKRYLGQLSQRPAPDGSTLFKSALAGEKKRAGLSSQSFAPADGKKRPVFTSRRRELAIIVPAVLLVLVLAVIASHWLFSPGTSSPIVVGKPSPHITQGTPGLTPTDATAPAQASATPVLSPTPHASATPALLNVTPLLDCVTQTGGNFHAEFGYQNPNAVAVTIPLGGKNVISPSNLDGPQPTSFAPGSHHQVFQVVFFKHGTVTWSLNGQTVTASSNSPQC